MAETHILQNIIPFVVAAWWSKSWLMDPIISRWRFAVSALSGSILWVYVAYSSTRAIDTSAGVTIEFGSIALAYFSGFMAFVSVLGFILGLLLWTEEEGRKAAADLPGAVKTQWNEQD